MSAWDKCIKLMEPLSEYMPDMDEADTVGGEMTRAVERIAYRWFNDGDNVGSWELYEGYGQYDIPSVTFAAAYILDEYRSFGPLGSKLKDAVEYLVYNDLNDSAYERGLIRLCQVARDIFDKSPEVFKKRNIDDMFKHEDTAEKIRDDLWEPEPEEEYDEDEDY